VTDFSLSQIVKPCALTTGGGDRPERVRRVVQQGGQGRPLRRGRAPGSGGHHQGVQRRCLGLLAYVGVLLFGLFWLFWLFWLLDCLIA
jgi:hypothetical protein